MSCVLPVKPGAQGGITWPIANGGQAATTVDRSAASDVLSAVSPGVLLPSVKAPDYSLVAQHELTATYKPEPLLKEGMSFFAHHLSQEGPVPAQLLQQLLLENIGHSTAAAAAAASQGNRLAVAMVHLPQPQGNNGSSSGDARCQQGTGRESQQQQPHSTAAAATSSSTGHADAVVLIASLAGEIGQLLCLSVVQPGPIPPHLVGGSSSSSTASVLAGNGPNSSAAAAGLQASVAIQVAANRVAVLDVGCAVQQVAIKKWSSSYIVKAAAAHDETSQVQQQPQQCHATLQALVLVQTMYKVYLAAVVYIQQQQQQQHTAEHAPSAAGGGQYATTTTTSSSSSTGSWHLSLLGYASFPAPLLTTAWHPTLRQVLLGSEDGAVWLVEVGPALSQTVLQQALRAATGQNIGPTAAAAVGCVSDDDLACLHPDKQLKQLLPVQLGLLPGWPGSTAAAAAAAAAAARTDGVQDTAAAAAAAAGLKLSLQIGSHPRHVLAGYGGVLMSYKMHSSGSSSSSDATTAVAAGAAAAPVQSGWLGKLLLQLPAGEALCSIATWQSSMQQWQQQQQQHSNRIACNTGGNAAAAGSSKAASCQANASKYSSSSSGSSNAMQRQAGCVLVRHLCAVATNRRLLLLDLRKAGEEPLLIWQHGMTQEAPGMLLLMPTPLKAGIAARACGAACFSNRHVEAEAAAAAIKTSAAGSRERGFATARNPAAPPAPGHTPGTGPLNPALEAAPVQNPRLGQSKAPGSEAVVYPSQLFAVSQVSGGAGLPGFGGSAGQGGGWLMGTEASQVGDPAALGLGTDPLDQQQQQQQQQQQNTGADPTQVHACGPAAATPSAAAVRVASEQAAAAAATAAAAPPDSAVDLWEICGTIVYAAVNNGQIHSVNFKLHTAAALKAGPVTVDGKAADALVTRSDSITQRLAAPAAAPAAARTTNGSSSSSSTQQVPGAAALCFVTAGMKALAVNASAAATAQGVQQQQRVGALGLGRSWVAGGARGFGQSPLGFWQLPAVVQATTSGVGKMLAGAVRDSAAAAELRYLQEARAAAAAAQHDERSAAEAGLVGAAADIAQANRAAKTLALMAAAPDTQGVALCPIPWCWTGGTARALLVRSSSEGDVLLQLCATQQVRLATVGKAAVAGGGKSSTMAATAGAGRQGGSGAAAAAVEPETLPRPVLVLAAAAADGGIHHHHHQQQQQQQQQQSSRAAAAPLPALEPTMEQAGRGKSLNYVERGFDNLEAWLDQEIEPPPIAVRGTATNCFVHTLEKRLTKQTVLPLEAHTAAVLQLLPTAPHGSAGLAQQQQAVHDVQAVQSTMQAVHLSSTAAAAKCSWPVAAGDQLGTTAVQASAAAAAAAAAEAADISSMRPSLHLWIFPGAPADAPKLTAAANTPQGQTSSAAAAAAARIDVLQQLLQGSPAPLTLLEVHLQLLRKQQQQKRTSSKHTTAAASGAVAAGTGQKRPHDASSDTDVVQGDDGDQQEQQQQQQQQEMEAAATAAARRDHGRGRGRGRGRIQPPGGRITRLGKLRLQRSQQQQQQQPQASAAAVAAAAVRGGGGVDPSDQTGTDSAAAAADSFCGGLSAGELRRLLQQQLGSERLRLSAQLLHHVQHAAAAAAAAAPVRQDAMDHDSGGDTAEDKAAAANAVQDSGKISAATQTSLIHPAALQSVLQTVLELQWQQQQQQQQQQGAAVGAAAPAGHLQLRQQQLAVQLRPQKIICHSTWQSTQQQQQQAQGQIDPAHASSAATVIPEIQQQQQQQQQGGQQLQASGVIPVAESAGEPVAGQAEPQQPQQQQQQQGLKTSEGCRVLPGGCALQGVLIEQPGRRLLDVQPRMVPRLPKAPAPPAAAAGHQCAVAAAAGSGKGQGSGSSSSKSTLVRVPPGLLALSMSAEAQQRWLQLYDDWPEEGLTAAAAAAGSGPAIGWQQQLGSGRQSKKQKKERCKEQAVQQQQQQQQQQHGLLQQSQALQQQRQQPSSSLLAHLSQQRPAQQPPRSALLVQPSQQQQQQPHSALLAQLSQPSSQQQQQQQPSSVLLVQQQQQQRPGQMQQRAASLLTQLSQQQQQQQQGRAGSVPSSLLMPSSRRKK